MPRFSCYYIATVLSLLPLQTRHVKSAFYVQTARNSELNNETKLALKRLADNLRKVEYSLIQRSSKVWTRIRPESILSVQSRMVSQKSIYEVPLSKMNEINLLQTELRENQLRHRKTRPETQYHQITVHVYVASQF